MSTFGNMIRWGKDGTSGAFDDLWLPVYGGEVITAFSEYNLFLDKVQYRPIASGNSAKFPALWKIGSEYHEAGTELLGLDVESVEYTLTLDDRPLVVHYAFDDIDEAMSHFEVRSQIANEAGQELARVADKNIAKMLILAAREAANGSHPGGTDTATLQPTGYADLQDFTRAGAVALLNAIEAVCIYWDNNHVPYEERFCAIPPGLYQKVKNLGLATTATEVGNGLTPVFASNDFNPNSIKLDKNGTWGEAIDFNGVMILKTPHLPGSSTSAAFTGSNVTTGPARYQGDFTNTAGVMWQKQALGVLQLMGVSVEQDRDVRRQQDFFLTKMHMGGGSLRPLAAVELNVA